MLHCVCRPPSYPPCMKNISNFTLLIPTIICLLSLCWWMPGRPPASLDIFKMSSTALFLPDIHLSFSPLVCPNLMPLDVSLCVKFAMRFNSTQVHLCYLCGWVIVVNPVFRCLLSTLRWSLREAAVSSSYSTPWVKVTMYKSLYENTPHLLHNRPRWWAFLFSASLSL